MKFARKVLKRALKRAVTVGALTQEQADVFADQAKGMGWSEIIELILMILEMIKEWLDQRNDD